MTQQLVLDAMALPPEERFSLARLLLESVNVKEMLVESVKPEQSIDHETLFNERLAEARGMKDRLKAHRIPNDEHFWENFFKKMAQNKGDLTVEALEQYDEPWQERDWNALFT